MIKYIIGLISAAALFLVGLALIFGESWYLENQFNVSPMPGLRQQDWLQNFNDVAFYQLITAVIFTCIWHSIGYFIYRLKNWSRPNGRIIWFGLFVAMLGIVAVIGWRLTEPSQDAGKILALAAYLINAAVIFYGSSLFFSPVTVKYTPFGAAPLHRIWN